MRFKVVGLLVAVVSCSGPLLAAIPSIAEIHANPIAAYQGVWETRFCSKDYQWKVEGNMVRMHRAESSRPASDYDNRYAVGTTVMLLNEQWDQSDRGVRLYASVLDPKTGYQSKGNAAALTSYVNNGITYLSFNEMIRVDEKQRQCGSSSKKEPSAKPARAPRPKPTEVSTRAEPKAPMIDQSAASPAPVPKGPTPNQLKYQRELADYNARLAEIEKIKADTAAKHAADTAAAGAELARHRRELAVAEAARKQYEIGLAAHQQLIRDRETRQDREAKVEWREAVAVCILDLSDGQAKFGNWRCDGPLQMNYAKLGNPGQAPSVEAIVALTMVCGGKREAVRDLGMVGDARLFGCSYGIHPQSKALDPLTKHGIGYAPGRAIYRCPLYVSGCRTQ